MIRSLVRRENPSLSSDPFFRSFERLFSDDMFRPFGLMTRWNEEIGQNVWRPAVDVRETDDSYLFTAELPGLGKKDVNITLEDNVLTLSGERTFSDSADEKNYRRIERAYGSFSRSFTLPAHVDAERVKAEFKDGLLTVTVPKAEQAKPRKIAIS